MLKPGDHVRLETRDEVYEGTYNGSDDDWFCVLVDNVWRTLIPRLDVVKIVITDDAQAAS